MDAWRLLCKVVVNHDWLIMTGPSQYFTFYRTSAFQSLFMSFMHLLFRRKLSSIQCPMLLPSPHHLLVAWFCVRRCIIPMIASA